MISIKISGAGAIIKLGRIQEGLKRRAGLHARMAGTGAEFTRQYVSKLHENSAEHETANKLGATPTGHFLKISGAIEGQSDETSVSILVPRASRLRAAFGSYVVTPKNVKWLTIPADARAYGKRAREFPPGALECRWMGRGLALVFVSDGKVAYWLVKKASIKEDRTLLPFTKYPELMARVANAYVLELINDSQA